MTTATISPQLRWYRRQAENFAALGLTVRGQRRQRRPNARNNSTRLEMRRLRGLQAWNLRVARLRKLGLTTRGTQRIYAVRRGDAVILKSQIDALAKSLARVFNDLPPAAQAKAIELEKQMGSIRQQL